MSNQSISQRLHDQLGQLIALTKPGDRLPSEPELARQLGVSRATLREAMRTFETQGLLRRRQGSGTYVNHPAQVIETGLEMLESIETVAQRIGLHTTLGALSVEQRPANEEECKALRITSDPSQGSDNQITSVSRVILAGGRPAAYLIDILPKDILTPEDLQNGFTGSVLDLLLRRGVPPLMVSRTEISAATATSAVARAMGIQRGDVLLRFVAELYSTEGRVVDFSISYFLPGYFRFHVVRRVG
ncbi:MAG: GntR family transcriptional regulator [Anaerolineales bacterium]|nr:GntR family transcriptional regulator [Anaerolineales bacterium]